MSEPTEALDDLYRQWRDPLYRVLVLATDDRDLALDAIDGSFVSLMARLQRTPSSHPVPEILRRAIVKTRKARSGAVRGFRLPDAASRPDAAIAVARLRSLDLVDRVVVLARLCLGWNDTEIAHATGVAVEDVPSRVDAAVQAILSDHGDEVDLVERRLSEALAGAGDAMARPLSRLESVKSDARSKRVIGVAAAGAMVAALALGAAYVVPDLLEDPSPDVVADGEPPPGGTFGDVDETSEPTATAEIGAIEWVETGLPFRNGELSAVTAGPDGFVAVASDWSDPSGQGLRLLESENGFEWTVLDAPGGARSGYMSDLRYADGRFVGVGSAFDQQRGTDTPFLIVTDEAGEWRMVDIATDDTIEVDGHSIQVAASLSSVTIDGDEIAAFGTQYPQDDLWALIEDALPEGVDGNGGWATSANGIEIYDERGDVVYTATAEELGIPDEILVLMSAGAPSMWRSTDGGETWDHERVAGAFGRDAYVGQIAGDGSTLLVVVHSGMGSALWSSDGDDWQRVDIEEGVGPTSIIRYGDRYFVSGVSGTGAGMWASADGVDWDRVGGEALSGIQADRVAGSEFGIVAVGQSRLDGAGFGPAVVEDGDLTLTMDATGRYVVTDGGGAVLLEVFAEDLVRSSGSEVSFVDPDTDEVILTVHQRDIDLAWEAVFRQAEVGGPAGAATTPAIAVSRDGVDWVRLDTSAFGTGFYPSAVALGPTSILVSGYRESGGESGPTLWVGELGE